MAREPWRYNPKWGTAIALEYCQFGYGVDCRCHMLFCKFRTTKEFVPKKELESMKIICPREQEYDEQRAAHYHGPAMVPN